MNSFKRIEKYQLDFRIVKWDIGTYRRSTRIGFDFVGDTLSQWIVLFFRSNPLNIHRKTTAIKFAFDRINTRSWNPTTIRRLSEGGELSARKSDDKFAITEHILDKENAQLKCFSDEPHVIRQQHSLLSCLLLSDFYPPFSSSLLSFFSLSLSAQYLVFNQLLEIN